jgi:uncharacterized protein YqeY
VVSLSDRLRAALAEARKARDPARTLLLSTILADLQNREIELQRAASEDEAAEQFTPAGRADLAARELAQVAMLEEFLPASAPPEEIRGAVRNASAGGAGDLGQVMGRVMPRFKGRADGRVINEIAREELSAGV